MDWPYSKWRRALQRMEWKEGLKREEKTHDADQLYSECNLEWSSTSQKSNGKNDSCCVFLDRRTSTPFPSRKLGVTSMA